MAAKKKPATKKKTAKKKTAAAGRKKRTPRYVNMEKALKDIDAPFDRDVFAYIAGWVQPDGRTWPDSPSLKTIAHHVAPDADSSRWAQYMVSFTVHDLEESGLLRIYRDYTQEDEHPRNIYIVNHCYMLDAAENTDPQSIGALDAIVEPEDTPSEPSASTSENSDTQNEPENTERPDDILRKLADLLADYHKNQNILAVGLQGAEDVAARIRGGQDHLAAVTLRRISDFLQDALA